MKTLAAQKSIVFSPLIALIFSFFMVFTACDDDDDASPDASYQKVNLVSSVSGLGANIVDANLVNAWGMAIGPTGAFWISSTERDLTTIYDYTGVTLAPPVIVPGEPTGVVYNATTDFVIPSTTLVSKFIYVGEEGTVHAWGTGSAAVEVADNSSEGAVYKGVAIGNNGESNFLYIANFSEGEIEVLDRNFAYVDNMPFTDASLPAGYAPFNIQNIGGKLYVTYALQSGDKYDDVPGAGHGYVNIFNTDGTFVKRFASQGNLNSPWGIARVPDDFGQKDNAILIGNFGDGRINVFDEDGKFLHALKDGDTPIEIDGLWAIMFPNSGVPASEHNHLYFTAGPMDEAQGLFGYIKER